MLEQAVPEAASGSGLIRFEVPRDDNASLVWPSLRVRELVQSARERQSRFPLWLKELSRRARDEVAPFVTSSKDLPVHESVLPFSAQTWLLGGHQPELFHPGVWFKNFLLHHLATRLGDVGEEAISLHITIDHDLVKPVSLRTTVMESGRLQYRMRPIPLRHSNTPDLPWELTQYLSHQRGDWERWLADVVEDCHSIGIRPLIEDLRAVWMELLESSPNLGETFSRFRQHVEREGGIRNAELSMSRLCSGPSFGEFFRRLALPESQLFFLYNEARDRYRLLRQIRNPVQPVPALQQQGGWTELPFWVYHRSLSIPRSRVWIQRDGTGWVLASEPRANAPWSLKVDLHASDWQKRWEEIGNLGICIRPRALMTTLYLRYVLADLFLHGIGGGVYDALTDEIAERLWGIERLPMMVASASFHLPVFSEPSNPLLDSASSSDPMGWESEKIDAQWGQLQRDLHRMRSAPETFLDLSDEAEAELFRGHHSLLEQRARLTGSRLAWHREMEALRMRIRGAVEGERRRLLLVSSGLMEAKRSQKIRRSREVPFILFPQSDVVPRLKSLLPHAFD